MNSTFRSRVSGAFGPRALAFFLVALLLGVPAAAARVMCLGRSCEARGAAGSNTPFCSLPPALRSAIAHGFYEGRSPDVMTVTGRSRVVGGSAFEGEQQPLWPSAQATGADRVPIVFSGRGVAADATVPAGVGLKDVAETVAAIIGLDRPHAKVRSGDVITGVATSETPALVLMVVWKNVGSDQLEAAPRPWPNLAAMMGSGAGTLDAHVGSIPLDPAAALTTIGTGGLPSEHGVTGSILRNNFNGRLVSAWGRGFPSTVIATLGDHLDYTMNEKPVIGLVGSDRIDRGLIGGTWYPGHDRDLVRFVRRSREAAAAERLLERAPFGKDDTPDLLAVALAGSSLSQLDRGLASLAASATEAANGSVAVVVTATGASPRLSNPYIRASRVERAVERVTPGRASVIAATTPGGFFLDQAALVRLKLSEDRILRALLRMKAPDGARLMTDVFPAIAVSFGRYC